LAEARGGKDRGNGPEFQAFIDACRRGSSWPISWGELYSVTWASLMAVQSLREGVPVELEGAAGGENMAPET
jgi:hypothetical protein